MNRIVDIMNTTRCTKTIVYLVTVPYVVASLFPDFQFNYKMMSHNAIELETIYDGFQIELIKFGDTANFELLTNYFSNISDRILIEGLEPCTKFEINAVVYNFETNVEFIHIENITTLSTELPVQIQSVTSLSNAIYVELNITRVHCIAKLYAVLGNSLQLFYTMDNITNKLMIKNLEPCTYYHIEILFNDESTFNQYLIYDNYVKTDPPQVTEPPIDLKFDPQTNFITWGKMILENCPAKYLITIKKYKNNVQKTLFTDESVLNKFDLQFLAKCLHFQISVSPKGNDSLSETINVESPYEEPDPITNISVDKTSENTLLIKWNRPAAHPDCIKNYAIKVNGVPHGTTSEFEYAFQELRPSKISNVSVCIITQHLTEKCTSATFRFAQMKMIQIKNVSEISVNSDPKTEQTIITWNELTEAVGIIRNYDITLVDTSRVLFNHYVTLTNRLEIPILPSCVSYSFHVRTIPIIKRPSIIESTFEFTTIRQKPFPPSTPSLLSKTTSSLTMKSSYRKVADKCGIETYRLLCARNAEVRFIDDDNGYGVIANLKSFTNYNCSVMVKSAFGWSDPSEIQTFSTLDGKTYFDLFAYSISSNSIGVRWSRRHVSMRLTITKIENKETLVPFCKYVEYNYDITSGSKRKKFKFSNLEPFTNYSIQAVGVGLLKNVTKNIIVMTHPDVPHQVINLKILNVSSHAITISWKLPCTLNGRVKGFVVKIEEPASELFYPFDETKNLQIFYYTVNQSATVAKRSNISVAIKLFNFHRSLNESTVAIFNIPMSDWLDDWVEIFIKDSTYAILNIKNETFMFTNEHVTGFSLLISERECHNLETDDVVLLILAEDNCIQQCHFSFVPNAIKIILNEETSQNCSNPSDIRLKRGPDYAILARVFTSRGYTDTFPIVLKFNQNFQNPSNFIMIFLLVLVCFVFITLSVTVIVWFRKNRNSQNVCRSATYIEVQHYPDFYKQIDQSFIANEYKSIDNMNLSSLPKTIGHNYPTKNRYINIIPYNYNRVTLTPNQFCTTDYINASYIDGEKQREQYVATQGPKDDTVYDFWHMVIEKNCDKIVMLTQLTEDNVAKCYKYYPNEGETLFYHDISIRNENEVSFGTFVRRELLVEQYHSTRLITQYQYLAWPDRDCPRNELSLIEFIEFTKNEKIKSTSPVVVHCSAGVGRTGTFIALDILLQSFRNDKYISIFDTVRKLRVQRCHMVQTVDQYRFLYATVNVYFHRRMYK